jgi:hypothetical protein
MRLEHIRCGTSRTFSGRSEFPDSSRHSTPKIYRNGSMPRNVTHLRQTYERLAFLE